MATLQTIFRIQDNYSSQMNRIMSSTTAATSSISRASAAVDSVDRRFTTANSGINRLTNSVRGLAAGIISVEAIKKGMDISDTYTNIASKMSLITQNATQLKDLQNDIFAAADRARGNYADMADTVSKLGIIAGEKFGNNENIVRFTETMQKMFKIGGTNTANQAGAMLQLQQAIGSGRLQGQDLRILAEDAPLVEKAIAQYMNKSVGDIKKLGSEGKITSDVLINSVLQYSSTVDKQMGNMSYTWGDYWNKIKNGAMKAFSSVFESESKMLGSKKFQKTIDGIIASFSVLANVGSKVLSGIADVGSFMSDNWSFVAPILGGVAAAMAILTTATWAQSAAQAFLNVVMSMNPFTLTILLIVALIVAIYFAVAAINHFAGTSISATGLIVGGFQMGIAIVGNLFIGFYNTAVAVMVGVANIIMTVAELFANGFKNPIGSAIILFATFGHAAMQILEAISSAFDAIFHTQTTKTLKAFDASVSSLANKLAGNSAVKIPRMDASSLQMKYTDPVNAWKTGYQAGSNFETGISDIMKKLSLADASKNNNAMFGTPQNPATIQGTGSGGNVTVNIADQDLQYLRDLAEKDYINKFSTAVLAPNISVSIEGTGNTTSDKNLSARISAILQEQISVAAEGNYQN